MNTSSIMSDSILMDAWDPAMVSPYAELEQLECEYQTALSNLMTPFEVLAELRIRICSLRASLGIEPIEPDIVVAPGSGAAQGPGPLILTKEEKEKADECELLDKLRSVRASLLLKQDELHRHNNTEEEIAAAEKENDELVRQIRCIEDTLLAFGSFYRSR